MMISCRARLANSSWLLIYFLGVSCTFVKNSSVITSAGTITKYKTWSKEEYPNPDEDAPTCRTSKSYRLCDPDLVLSRKDLEQLDDFLSVKRFASPPFPWDKRYQCLKSRENTPAANQLEIQFGVALVKVVNLNDVRQYPIGIQREKAAELFARRVHDEWGVGLETESCGGAGVLLFASAHQRTMYISRGHALEKYLTNYRLDQVLANKKDLLDSGLYYEAIYRAIDDIMGMIEKGPPAFYERIYEYVHYYYIYYHYEIKWLCLHILVFLGMIWGRFVSSRTTMELNRDYAKVASQLHGLDRARAEALQGKYCARSCPLCFGDFQPPETEGGAATIGSDGKPIKLLKCGHVLDYSCWSEWVKLGTGDVTKCIVCNEDVGCKDNYVKVITDHDGASTNALQVYLQDRNFRLQRLHMKYPQYIGTHQLKEWNQVTHNFSLAQDPMFLQCNPVSTSPAWNGNGNVYSSRNCHVRSGFGGSSSGGGRGGSW